MQHVWSIDELNLSEACITIGLFDGVHRGHQTLINKVVASAQEKNVLAVVVTFHPHPAVVLRPNFEPVYLTHPNERAGLLANLGVDNVVTVPFTRQIAAMPGKRFLQRLNQSIPFREIWVGNDFAMGHNRDLSVTELRQAALELGFEVCVLEDVTSTGQRISSSQIRKSLLAGNVTVANQLLGRQYVIRGEVIHGDGRGRTIGIPTANLAVWKQQLVPANGVYACEVEIDGVHWLAATNIGTRPTFNGQHTTTIEAHVIDYHGDLYGRSIALAFSERLRGEKRFTGINELVEQIRLDIQTTRTLLEK